MKSQQKESDGRDSFMVQRPIEMVSNQDRISVAASLYLNLNAICLCSFILPQLTLSCSLQDAPLLNRSPTNSLLSCIAARCTAVRPFYTGEVCNVSHL